ncbi:MAG: type II toxin-antitoxin system RelE/ParE family toxin [bacterium]
MAEVIWTELALEDLQDIIEYIAKDSFVYAERFGVRVAEAPRRLAQFPFCGRIVPEFEEENIRELIYESYRIIYLIREKICYIVAILHGSRDILRCLKPGDWDIA